MSTYKTQEEFFKNVGDDYIEPTYYGESHNPITVEEMYQHFKERLISELRVDSVEFLDYAELIDCETKSKQMKILGME